MSMERFTVNLAPDKVEYTIGNYTFIVSSKFMPFSEKTTLTDCIEKHIESEFAHLTKFNKGAIITDEYIPTAGKEAKCSQKTSSE